MKIFKITQSSNKRESTFELIRVISMSLIIIHHFFYYCIPSEILSHELYNLINPFFYVGVNLFFLISGWFTIKFNLKKLLSFIILVLFFDIINILICISLGIKFQLIEIIRYLIFPISASPYWFLQVYLFLMLIAPIINKALSLIKLKNFRFLVILLTIATVFSGCLGGNISNSNGFSFMQGLYLYIIGYYLHLDKKLYLSLNKSLCLVSYILLLFLGGMVSIITHFDNFILYNSFSIIGAAVCLFIFLSKFSFQNNFINLIGNVAVGCYMLQDGLLGREYIYNKLSSLWSTDLNLIDILLVLAIVFISFWIISIVITPALKFISEILSKRILKIKFFEKFNNLSNEILIS